MLRILACCQRGEFSGLASGPISPRPWGATTAKGNTVYVHVLDWPDPVLAIPLLRSIRRASLLGTGRAVEFLHLSDATLLTLPAEARDPIDTVVVLDA